MPEPAVPRPGTHGRAMPRIHGRIAYRDAEGRETGHERFDLCAMPGGYLLRALCLMDDIGLVRDVSIAMDAQWRPIDGWSRIVCDGSPASTQWFRVRDGIVRVDGGREGSDDGHVIPVEGRLPYLGLHPLQGDALIVMQRGTDRPGAYQAIAAVTNSVSPNGDEDIHAQAVTIAVAFIGEEEIEVAAGRFKAHRYALRWREDWPAADLWVRAGDCLFLRMRWSFVPAWFELTQLIEEEGPGA